MGEKCKYTNCCHLGLHIYKVHYISYLHNVKIPWHSCFYGRTFINCVPIIIIPVYDCCCICIHVHNYIISMYMCVLLFEFYTLQFSTVLSASLQGWQISKKRMGARVLHTRVWLKYQPKFSEQRLWGSWTWPITGSRILCFYISVKVLVYAYLKLVNDFEVYLFKFHVLQNVKYLTQLSNFKFMLELPYLECLVLDHNYIESHTKFPQSARLTTLWVNHNNITNLSKLVYISLLYCTLIHVYVANSLIQFIMRLRVIHAGHWQSRCRDPRCNSCP